VSRVSSFRGIFSFLFTQSRAEGVVAEYVVREHHQGCSLTEILGDPYVVNRLSRAQIERLLDRPEVVHAIGEDMISRARSEL
jgi:hypothetical protein